MAYNSPEGELETLFVDDYELIDRFELTEPTVIRVREPHGVVMDEDNPPRIKPSLIICSPIMAFITYKGDVPISP